MQKNTTRLWTAALLSAFFLAPVSCSQTKYLETRNSNCKFFDPHPVSGQSIEWDGACIDGYANGYGVLVVYEKNRKEMECRGSAIQGKFQGTVVLSMIKDEEAVTEYEDEWVSGFPVRRIRNITLATHLQSAGNARAYLHRLKLFQQKFPDAWLDDFHDVLAAKTLFVCEETPKPGQVASQAKQQKIPHHELVIKISDDGHADHGYYTVYNHRVESLKKLYSDRFRPGGSQLHASTDLSFCTAENTPDQLPPEPAKIIKNIRHADPSDPPPAALHWYPVRRY